MTKGRDLRERGLIVPVRPESAPPPQTETSERAEAQGCCCAAERSCVFCLSDIRAASSLCMFWVFEVISEAATRLTFFNQGEHNKYQRPGAQPCVCFPATPLPLKRHRRLWQEQLSGLSSPRAPKLLSLVESHQQVHSWDERQFRNEKLSKVSVSRIVALLCSGVQTS